MIEIQVAVRVRQHWIDAGLLRRVARHVAAAEGFKSGSLSIAIIGKRAMAALHRCTLNIAEPTDVLTFDFRSRARRGVLDAEVVACADVAWSVVSRQMPRTEQSKIQDPKSKIARAAMVELALYVTHGILHLAGHDDQTAVGYRRMHMRENALLAGLGLGTAYGKILE